MEVEKIALADEGVKAEIAKLQLPEGTVVISDPWPYGECGVISCRPRLTFYRHRWLCRRNLHGRGAPISVFPLCSGPKQF